MESDIKQYYRVRVSGFYPRRDASPWNCYGQPNHIALKQVYPTWKDLVGTIVKVLEGKYTYKVEDMQGNEFWIANDYLTPISPLELLALEAPED